MKELLYEFLAKEGALFNYLEIAPSLDNVVLTKRPDAYLSWFIWMQTKQGTEYWMNLHEKWSKFYSYRYGTAV